jgi:hypothetical protein
VEAAKIKTGPIFGTSSHWGAAGDSKDGGENGGEKVESEE